MSKLLLTKIFCCRIEEFLTRWGKSLFLWTRKTFWFSCYNQMHFQNFIESFFQVYNFNSSQQYNMPALKVKMMLWTNLWYSALDGKNLQTKSIGGIIKTNSIMVWFFGRTVHKYPVAINESQGKRDDTNLLKCKTNSIKCFVFFLVEIQSVLLVYSRLSSRTIWYLKKGEQKKHTKLTKGWSCCM